MLAKKGPVDTDAEYYSNNEEETDETLTQYHSGTEDGDLTSSSLSAIDEPMMTSTAKRSPPFRTSHDELNNRLNMTRSLKFQQLKEANRRHHESRAAGTNLLWIPGYGLLRS